MMLSVYLDYLALSKEERRKFRKMIKKRNVTRRRPRK